MCSQIHRVSADKLVGLSLLTDSAMIVTTAEDGVLKLGNDQKVHQS
jgi:hypothetical protein